MLCKRTLSPAFLNSNWNENVSRQMPKNASLNDFLSNFNQPIIVVLKNDSEIIKYRKLAIKKNLFLQSNMSCKKEFLVVP